VRDNSASTYYISAQVSLIPGFQLNVLKQPCVFLKGERIYNSMGKIANITAVLGEL